MNSPIPIQGRDWSKARILVVDDDPQVRTLLVRFLEADGFEALVAADGQQALEMVAHAPPDLIILDVDMPRMNGLELCRRLKQNENTALIPVTMLTGYNDAGDRVEGLEAGADDFLAKPFDPATLRARIRSHMRIKRLTDQLERTETVIFCMARWVEMKDEYTEAHLRRVAGYGEQTARALGLAGEELSSVRHAGILHDVGKIGVPDSIIGKKGPLSSLERRVLEKHSGYGAQIVAPMRFAATVAPIIHAHHERWDGDGYPRQLAAKDIPLGARIIAVVDAWDAMTTHRPYRRSLGEVEAMRRLREGAGSQWDPEIVRTFLRLLERGELTSIDLPGLDAMAA
jgi:putative two-component system response regulator